MVGWGEESCGEECGRGKCCAGSEVMVRGRTTVSCPPPLTSRQEGAWDGLE